MLKYIHVKVIKMQHFQTLRGSCNFIPAAPGSRIYYEPIAQNASYLIVRDLNANDRGRYVCAAGLTIRVAMTLVVYGKFEF